MQNTEHRKALICAWQSQQRKYNPDSPIEQPYRKSAIARLTSALINLSSEVLLCIADGDQLDNEICINLGRSRSCLILWSDSHGIANGNLDDKFKRSSHLRRVIVKTLLHISCTLIDRLIPQVPISGRRTDELCAKAIDIIEEIDFFSHDGDDSSSDASSGFGTEDVYEIAEDLRTDVECLIELDPILKNPVMDPAPVSKEINAVPSSLVPHQVFMDMIENRFPRADAQLISFLGRTNFDRYFRCQAEREYPGGGESDDDGQVPELQENTGSKFHDSALGSSIPAFSSYAETVMSYRDGNRSVRIPQLPEEAKRGESFSCVACGRSMTIANNSQWKQHLYLDLQPYVCLYTSCHKSNSTSSSRTNWISHLALDHSMEPDWKPIHCQLCQEEIGPGKISITTHLGRHLEELSLSALPPGPDSESNSEVSDLESVQSLEMSTLHASQDLSQNVNPDRVNKARDTKGTPIELREAGGTLLSDNEALSHETSFKLSRQKQEGIKLAPAPIACSYSEINDPQSLQEAAVQLPDMNRVLPDKDLGSLTSNNRKGPFPTSKTIPFSELDKRSHDVDRTGGSGEKDEVTIDTPQEPKPSVSSSSTLTSLQNSSYDMHTVANNPNTLGPHENIFSKSRLPWLQYPEPLDKPTTPAHDQAKSLYEKLPSLSLSDRELLQPEPPLTAPCGDLFDHEQPSFSWTFDYSHSSIGHCREEARAEGQYYQSPEALKGVAEASSAATPLSLGNVSTSLIPIDDCHGWLNGESAERVTCHCGKSFRRPSNLAKHQKYHIKYFSCLFSGCEKAFATQKDLSRHARTHRKGEGYRCTVDGCRKAAVGHIYSRRDNFDRHMRTAHPEL